MNTIVLLPVLLPVIIGIGILIGKEPKRKNYLLVITGLGLSISATTVFYVLSLGELKFTFFNLTKELTIYYHIDGIGKIFAVIITLVWVLGGFFSFIYMKHEHKHKRYYGFYLIVFGILISLAFSGNIITFYFFYELMTILSTPLVFHSQTKPAIMAGLKYLFYSFFGAYMVLFGIYFLFKYGTTFEFRTGGVLNSALVSGNEGILLVAAFVMILGFSVKAGMFPMHAWLPVAHPVAPAPASAVLSGIIVKAGVLGIIRVVFFMFGADFLRGTWVQTAWIVLALITIFMGSMLAYWEKDFKKRLAYSTVSQVSYILLGLAMLHETAFTGAMLHTICHAFVKSALFLCAGTVIFETGKKKVNELRGIGKQMPVTMWGYTFASLALIGIPPTSGFISKWYLAVGTLQSGMKVISWLGPVILLISALLTAGYLLPITINGFLPGKDYPERRKKEPAFLMWGSICILVCLAVGIGLLPNVVIDEIERIAVTIF